MEGFSYETQGSTTYLVYEISPNDIIDSMSLGMLTNNKIPGLAQTLFTQMNDKKLIRYNVSSKVCASQFFTGTVNKKRLLGVFSGIVSAMLSAEDYMIDVKSILLDMDYIFADVSSCETVLLCLPFETSTKEQLDLGSFFKNIMFSTQFDQTENCDHVAKIINYLNGTPIFSLHDFKEVLDEVAKEQVAVKVASVVKPPEDKKVTVTPQPVVTNLQPTVTSKAPTTAVTPTSQPNPALVAGQSKPPVSSKPAQVPTESVPPQKTMSWFYLMQHYNKENAEAYKAQKEAKKKGGKAVLPSAKTATPGVKPQTTPKVASPGYTVPGQAPANVGYAVPGQTPPVSVPASQAQQNASIQPKNDGDQPATSVQQPPVVPRQVPQGQSMNFGETTVLGGGAIGETTVLTAGQNPNKVIAPHLIRKKNNKKISINKPVFRIGKEKSYVDYFIGDNTAISRSHADIITRDGTYLIVDVNSTNHTFVNGTMIQPSIETPINHGDTIRLANEDFEFKLY